MHSFSVRKNGVWSDRPSTIGITFDPNAVIPPEESIRVGIITRDSSESGYREANVKDLAAAFSVSNGYDATFATASTAIRQLQAVRDFITTGVEYILICPAERVGRDDVLQTAKNDQRTGYPEHA